MRLHLALALLVLLSGAATAQDTNFPVGPQYLITGSPLVLHSIATPSLDLNAPPASTTAEGSGEAEAVLAPAASQPAAAQNEANLQQVFWGTPAATEPAESSGEVEVTAPQPDFTLPPSFFDGGVTAMVTDRSLAGEGYGVTLAQAAAFAKAHRKPGSHVYTNDDIARLHGG